MKKWVLTVPMRNGNVSTGGVSEEVLNRSYRTYEEWKPGKAIIIMESWHSSYRTYEEWKLGNPKLHQDIPVWFLPYL